MIRRRGRATRFRVAPEPDRRTMMGAGKMSREHSLDVAIAGRGLTQEFRMRVRGARLIDGDPGLSNTRVDRATEAAR